MTDRETVDIGELIELLGIPEVEDQFWKKLQSVKTDVFSKHIMGYREKKSEFRRRILEGMRVMSKDGGGVGAECNNEPYWFEMMLYREQPCLWNITVLEPQPPPFYDRHEIVPVEVFKCIDEAPVDPDTIRMPPGIRSELYGKTYDLKFMRFSRNHAFGAIMENNEGRAKRYLEMDYSFNESMDMAYREFFSYMRRFPDIRDHFFNEFFYVIKPMQDREFIVIKQNEEV